MRKIIASFIAAAFVFVGGVALAQPAQAGRGCVTVAEAKATHWKMRRARVENIFDAPSRLSDRFRRGRVRFVSFDYPRCSRGWVHVLYKRRSSGPWRAENQNNIRRHKRYV